MNQQFSTQDYVGFTNDLSIETSIDPDLGMGDEKSPIMLMIEEEEEYILHNTSSYYTTDGNGKRKVYDWKTFAPLNRGVFNFLRWLVVGASKHSRQSDEEMQQNLISLARMLSLLREYEARFGMPKRGGPRDQEHVLTEVCTRLYGAGAPIWALEPVMTKAAEGLTGARGVDFFMLPRKAFIFAPSSGATSMFPILSGFKFYMLQDMERVIVRLASFASNTQSVNSLPSRFPRPHELRLAAIGGSLQSFKNCEQGELVDEILTLASEGAGLFFFTRRREDNKKANTDTKHPADSFWTVEDSTRELFSRLATIEALDAIDKIDAEAKELYPNWLIVLFRMISSAGSCGLWFNGSWLDMLVASSLACVTACVGTTSIMKHERVVFEVVVSFSVGLIAGLIALQWPDDMCYGAIALGGVRDVLQGFKVVYAIIEVMSRHSVAGGANLLEGILFTGLIAFFLKLGQYVAAAIKGNADEIVFPECINGLDQRWYFLLVPLAALSWSGLFKPYYNELPLMALHGILAYLTAFLINHLSGNYILVNFCSALIVTVSAGFVSRFTGRQALGNAVAGLYVLLPGAYMVNEIFTSDSEGFIEDVITRAITIGIGAWTGTILCSPTLLGTNRGLMQQSNSTTTSLHGSGPPEKRRKASVGPMLFF